MLKFYPPELRDDLAAAIEAWKESIDISWAYDFSEDIVDVTDPDFDPADHEDRLITHETEFELSLPKWEDVTRVTYGEFIELVRELSGAELQDARECRTELRYLLRVDTANDQTTRFLLHTLPDAESESEAELQSEYIEIVRELEATSAKLREMFDKGIDRYDDRFDEVLWKTYQEATQHRRGLEEELEGTTRRYCQVEVSFDGHDATCSLTEGFTVFGTAVAASGDYDKYLPPVMGDLFVEVRYRLPIPRETARYVAEAYLFELSSTLGLEFQVAPRPSVEDEDFYSEGDLRTFDVRLRPLLLGKGMPELLKLYNRALSAPDDEVRILYFVKVIEYVSRTVVGQQATEAIRTKLLSARSLNPDAGFIAELQAIIEEQRAFRKDREAIKQAVMVCCEASELVHVAPPFLSKLGGVSPSDSSKKKEEALAEVGASLYATRNRIAHAKANYLPTGEECPEEQLAPFAECAKLAAQQAVRWYHSRPENTRIL